MELNSFDSIISKHNKPTQRWGDYSNHSNCMGGFGLEWSHTLHTQGVFKFGKKF
jgi:hypothetical protein